MEKPLSDAISSASELVVRYSHHTVLDGATLAIQQGDHIGLVGRNGCGKSTFMKIIAGEAVGDTGEVTNKRGLVTGYLPQLGRAPPSYAHTRTARAAPFRG